MNRTEKQAWGVLLAFSLFARLVDLGHRALSHDESLHALYSWYWSNGLKYDHDPMMHGPLLFHLNGIIFSLFPATDFTARVIPALFGTGAVALLLLYRRWLGPWGAFWAACLVSLDPGHLFFSRYLRNDIYITCFTLLMVWAVLRYREDPQPRFLRWLAVGLGLSFVCKEVCFIHGVMLGAGCGLFSLMETLRSGKRSISTWLQHPCMECAVLIFLLALPFISGLLVPKAVWSPPGAIDSALQTRGIQLALSLLAGTLAVGSGYFFWRERWSSWITAALIFWGLQITLYSTLFTNLRGGFASGVVGSLGYWWAQHDVQRGNTDPAFYLTLLLLYTPVLLLGAGLAVRRIRELPFQALFWWAVVHAAIYSWAGERMPWLLIHISLPLCLLTGSMLPSLFRSTAPRARVLQVLMVLGVFQLVTNSLRLAGPNAEGAREPMVYAHTGPDFKIAIYLLQDHLQRYPGTRAQIAPAYAWPTAWYLRETPAGYQAVDTPESVTAETSVLLVSPAKREEMRAAGWISRVEVDMTTWPRSRYHRISLQNLKQVMTHPPTRHLLWGYVLHRAQPEWRDGEFPGPNRFLLMTRAME